MFNTDTFTFFMRYWYFASYRSSAEEKNNQYLVDGCYIESWTCFSWYRASNYYYSALEVRNLLPVWFVLLSVFFCDIIKVNHYIQFFIFRNSNDSSFHTPQATVPYEYYITQWSVCSLLSFFVLNAILLTFAVNTLRTLPLFFTVNSILFHYFPDRFCSF